MKPRPSQPAVPPIGGFEGLPGALRLAVPFLVAISA
jgi:hypothetical protein